MLLNTQMDFTIELQSSSTKESVQPGFCEQMKDELISILVTLKLSFNYLSKFINQGEGRD